MEVVVKTLVNTSSGTNGCALGVVVRTVEKPLSLLVVKKYWFSREYDLYVLQLFMSIMSKT